MEHSEHEPPVRKAIVIAAAAIVSALASVLLQELILGDVNVAITGGITGGVVGWTCTAILYRNQSGNELLPPIVMRSPSSD